MLVLSMMQRAGVAARLTGSDSAQSLAAGVITESTSGKSITDLLVQCDPSQSNSMRVTWGGTSPTQGASAIGIVLDPGDVIRLVGSHNASTFEYINATNGSNGVLQIVPGY